MNDATARNLSRQLRLGNGSHLEQRRATIALSLIAMGSLGAVTLYQTGLIRHLPEPPLSYFDADTVDAAPEAYATLATPDGVLGLVSYATTSVLAAAGSADRSRTRPALPIALAAKVALDAVMSAKLTADQWAKHRAWCFWCLTASLATFATVPSVIPEARAALKTLRER